MTDLTIRVVHDPNEFAAMRESWNELLASSSSDSLFLTWEWLHTWWTHFGANRRLNIVTVRTESELIAIAPLTVDRAWIGVPLFEFAGTGTIGSDYLDLIIRRGHEDVALDAIATFLANRTTSMRLPRIAASSAIARRLGTALAKAGWHRVEVKTEICPFIDLKGQSFDEYLATLGSSHRYNFRRRLKNLMRDHDVQIEYAQTDASRREALDDVIALHLQRWNARGGSDAFNGPELHAFHEEFSALALANGWLRMMVVRIDGRAAAAFYGFRYRDKFIFYQSGFDPAYERSSVGLVMIGLTIRDAVAEDATEYDFLHGDEAYKFLWTRRVRQLVRLELYPPSQLGLLHRQADRVKAAARRFAKRVLRPETPAVPAEIWS